MEYLNNGSMEYWRNEVLEQWSIGSMEFAFHHSNNPSLQNSISPSRLNNSIPFLSLYPPINPSRNKKPPLI